MTGYDSLGGWEGGGGGASREELLSCSAEVTGVEGFSRLNYSERRSGSRGIEIDHFVFFT